MEQRDPKLREIWNQQKVPVILLRSRPKPLAIRLPYGPENFEWLRGEKRNKPTWNPGYKCWETPVAWFDELVHRALEKHKRVYVIQLYRQQQKCAPACWNAEGFHCECSCMGSNHGSGHPGGKWHEVSDTFAFNWGAKQYACRLIVADPKRSKS